MDEEVRRKIEEIMEGMNCPKAFRCADAGFEGLCQARDFGLENYLECHDDEPRNCSFALPYAHEFFCQCPLRVYLAKKLRK